MANFFKRHRSYHESIEKNSGYCERINFHQLFDASGVVNFHVKK